MSLTQAAFLERAKVPDRRALEDAVQRLGFDLKVDEFYEPYKCKGFLPCTLRGAKSGFEIYFGSSEEYKKRFPHLAERIGERDTAIEFRWGGDMAECVCVLMTSAALASSFGAIVHYEPDDLVYTADQLINEVKSALASLDSGPKKKSESQPRPAKSWWRIW